MTTTDAGWALGSKYLLHECIGSGATGEVWSATSREGSQCLAVKLLRRELVDDPEVRLRFLHEGVALADRLATLAHPGIVPVREVVAEGRHLALVMEFVAGPSLREYLAEERTLAPALACRLTAELAAAVGAAHALEVVHRDLKPENVLLQASSYGPTARVVDFGVARLRHGAGLTTRTHVPGTLPYLAPELLAGAPATAASDVYALGVLLAELLIGRRPTEKEREQLQTRRGRANLTGPLRDLPQPLLELVVACLSADARRRPTADGLGARLRPLVASLRGVRAQPAAPPPETAALLADPDAGGTAGAATRPPKRRRLAVWSLPQASARWGAAGGAVFLLLAAALVVPELLTAPDQPPNRKVAQLDAAPGSEEVPLVTPTLGPTAGPVPTDAAPEDPPAPALTDATVPPAPVPGETEVAGRSGPSTGTGTGTSAAPAPGNNATSGGQAPTAPTGPGVNRTQAPAPPAPAPPAPTAPPEKPATKTEPVQPYSATQACGNGFYVINQHPLPRSVVYLLWNRQTQQNCVVTLKTADIGTKTSTTAYLKPDGGTAVTDPGMYQYYAEVTARTPGCISWGGSDGVGEFRSPSGQHCG